MALYLEPDDDSPSFPKASDIANILPLSLRLQHWLKLI